jgi:hypothetical protein
LQTAERVLDMVLKLRSERLQRGQLLVGRLQRQAGDVLAEFVDVHQGLRELAHAFVEPGVDDVELSAPDRQHGLRDDHRAVRQQHRRLRCGGVVRCERFRGTGTHAKGLVRGRL